MLNIEALRAAIPALKESDAKFAGDLIRSFDRYGSLTSRQEPWVDRLIERSQPAKPAEHVGNLSALLRLFDLAASRRKKQPEVTIEFPGIGAIVIARAGDKARVPGAINVQTPGRYGENTWYGRILRDGTFDKGNKGAVTPAGLISQLQAFAANPAPMAATYGIKSGRCCFCDHALTTDESKSVGYGPDCADNFGLPWGKRAAKAAKAQDANLFAAPVEQHPTADDALEAAAEAAADRAQTERDERAKHAARATAEAYGRSSFKTGIICPDRDERAAKILDRWSER
jgi:hypothetical protein